MAIIRVSMTKKEKMAARLRLLGEFKDIKFTFNEEEREMIKNLPEEINGALLQQPLLQEEGMNIFMCYNLYQRLADYIAEHKIPQMDPLRLWASKKYWSDVIYTSYFASKYADGGEGLFLKDVIFKGKDNEKYRKKYNRNQRMLERVSYLKK